MSVAGLRRYCPSCDAEVEVAEGRCWECAHLFGWPVSEAAVLPSAGVGVTAASLTRNPMSRLLDGEPPRVTPPSQDTTLVDRLRDDQADARRLKT